MIRWWRARVSPDPSLSAAVVEEGRERGREALREAEELAAQAVETEKSMHRLRKRLRATDTRTFRLVVDR